MFPIVRYHVAPFAGDPARNAPPDLSTHRTAILSRNHGEGELDLAVQLHAGDLEHPAFSEDAAGRTQVLRLGVPQGTGPGCWSEWP